VDNLKTHFYLLILGLVVPEGQAAKQKLLTAGKTAFFNGRLFAFGGALHHQS